MILQLISLLQVDVIKEKIENAPDRGYEIGVFIGTYLPFVILIIIAYLIYFKMKKRKDFDNQP